MHLKSILQSDWVHKYLHRGTEIGPRVDQTLSPPQQNKMADQGTAAPDYGWDGLCMEWNYR